MKELLYNLCLAAGVSGDESAVADLVQEHLSRYAHVRRDALGNVIGEADGSGTHILLDAHIDQIGLIVTDIDKTGFLRFSACGRVDLRLLSGAEVTVWGKEPLYGVISSTPPHLTDIDDAGKAKGMDKLGIDIGFCEKEARERVSLGDKVTVNSGFFELLGSKVSAAPLDNRAGAAVILRALELLKDKKHDKKVSVLFSVLEESGGRGATAAAFGIAPDEAIVVDVSFADSAGADLARLGSGAMIGISPVLSREVTNKLKNTADKKSIPYTLEVMRGATHTNADKISVSGKGVKTALVSVPLRYMHSAVEIVDINDIESCARLIAEHIAQEGEGKGND